MDLFIWNEVVALADHRNGMVFAHATDKTQAIKLVLRSMIDELRRDIEECPALRKSYMSYRIPIIQELSKELRQKNPLVIDEHSTYGLAVHGSA
jgi:hypothetical protein